MDLKLNFVQFEKLNNGSYHKVPKSLKVGICEYEDFYNKYNKQIDYLGLKDFYCIKNKEFTIQGIYLDKIFSYYEISSLAKNKSDEHINEYKSSRLNLDDILKIN